MSQTLTYVMGADHRVHVKDIQDFKIDFSDDNHNWVQARQFERGMRQVFVNIVNEDGTPFDLTGCNVWFEGLLPKTADGDFRVIDDDGYVPLDPSAGKFRYDMPGHAFTVAGSYRQAFFRIVKNGNSVTTLEFDLDVLADKVIDGLVPKDWIGPFEEIADQLVDGLQKHTDAADKIISDFQQKVTDLVNQLNQQGSTTTSMLTELQNRITDLETKIKQDGLFTQAEAEAFENTLKMATVHAYPTLSDMLNDSTLLAGMTATTAGYYQAGDGGGATYQLSSTEPETYYEKLKSGLYAELISKKPTFEEFGAKGDGTSDDTGAINKALTYSKATKKIISAASEKAVYSYQGDLTLDGVHLDAFGTLKGSGTAKITNGAIVTRGTFDGFNVIVDGYHASTRHVTIHSVPNGIVFHVVNDGGDLYNINDGNYGFDNIYIDNLDVNGDSATGLQVDCPDATFTNFLITNCHTAIQNNASNSRFINCYAWLNGKMTFTGTTYFATTTANYHLTNCTNDSYQTTFAVDNAYCVGTVNGFQFVNNNNIFHGQTFTFLNRDCRLRGNAVARLEGFNAANNVFHITGFSNVQIEFFGNVATDHKFLFINSDLSKILKKGTLSSDSYARYIDDSVQVQAFLTFNDPVASADVTEYIQLAGLLGNEYTYGTGYAPALYESSDGSWAAGLVRWEVSTATAHNIKITCPMTSKPYDKLMSCSLNLALPVSVIMER